jgi:hypothetical protein
MAVRFLGGFFIEKENRKLFRAGGRPGENAMSKMESDLHGHGKQVPFGFAQGRLSLRFQRRSE